MVKILSLFNSPSIADFNGKYKKSHNPNKFYLKQKNHLHSSLLTKSEIGYTLNHFFRFTFFDWRYLMTIQKTLQKDSVLIGQLELYNRLWKEQDDIWQKAARKSSLPRTSYWILYTIVVTSPAPLSQADLCEKWYFPRQTVNSAVKKLVSDGLVSLFTQKGSGNIKYLRLTPKGEELAAAYVAPLVQADIHSFSAFSAEERSLLLKLMQQQLTSLKEYSEQLWN